MSVITPCPTCSRLMTDGVCIHCMPIQPSAPMTRREEVEKEWLNIYENYPRFEMEPYRSYALTLADEVDALRGQLLALGKKAIRYENEREINAGLVAERDAVITKLLAMLEPGSGSFGTHVDDSTVSLSAEDWSLMERIHARACEIAGRKE